MSLYKTTGMVFLSLALILGCSGDTARIKTQSAGDSKVTQQELIDNWSDYSIWFRSTVIVFDPKDDDRHILVGNNWGTVKDQATWTRIVEANTTSQGNLTPVWADFSMTNVREIWSRDNQLFGYVIHQQGDLVSARLVEPNTMRVFYSRARVGGP